MDDAGPALKSVFPFCKGCPADSNCCTGKTVDLPVLTPKDVGLICRKTGLAPRQFCLPTRDVLSTMRSRKGVCYFYKQGKCSIYRFRPVDCRLFPFDVHVNDEGKAVLVLHVNACPQRIDAEAFAGKVWPLVRQIKPYLKEFAEYRSPRSSRHSYKVFHDYVQV